MSKVRLLDKHTAELIAAGEVVERPSSVVKELVENCIDAHATVVTVEIKHGGASFLRVTDNGEGMAPDDVPTAFLRHATSKIRVGTDLDSIATLGFRGEALASICAVSKVEEMFYNTPARRKFLKSDKSEGNAIAAVLDRVAMSHPEISFRFIREGREVLLTPGDGRLKSAIHAVYGRDFTAGLLPVKYRYNNISVEGFISKPINARPNRAMQIFFINGRYVRSRTMQNALEEACKGAVMIGKFPACVLGISLDCSAVDVNVHPAKLEVRFTEEKPIYEAVYFSVKSALAEFDAPRDVELPHVRRVNTAPNMHEYKGVQIDLNEALRADAIRHRAAQVNAVPPVRPSAAPPPTLPGRGEASEAEQPLAVQDPGVTAAVGSVRPVPPPSYEEAVRAHEPEIAGTLPPCPPREVVSTPSEKEAALTGGENLPHEDERLLTGNDSAASLADIEKTEQTVEEIKASTESFLLPDYRIIGELFDTYIMIESGSELLLIDKHAAHERLNYERLMAQRQHPESQMLLTPLPVTLDKQQYDAVTDNIGLLAEAGFEVEDFGMGTVLVRSVPTILSGSDAEGAFLEIAGYLGSRLYAATTDHIDWIYHTISCKSAIKGGDKNLPAELTELVLTLMHHPDVRYCPHGRPIYISLKQREIEKYFGRIQS